MTPGAGPFLNKLSRFESTGISVQEKLKIDFQGGSHGVHLGLLIKMILAIFDLLVTPILPTKFGVKWPFDSGEVQNRLSRWPRRSPAWISDWTNFG